MLSYFQQYQSNFLQIGPKVGLKLRKYQDSVHADFECAVPGKRSGFF